LKKIVANLLAVISGGEREANQFSDGIATIANH
jgi:hypothetical protein